MTKDGLTRKEFLEQLESLLRDLPEHDRLDAMAYYEDYFEEAGPENESVVIQKLGSPQKVAATIKNGSEKNESAEYTERGYRSGGPGTVKDTPVVVPKESKKQKRQISWALVIVILIFTLPLWGGLLSGVFGVVAGVVATGFALLLALMALVAAGFIGGIACIVAGIAELFVTPALGLLLLGLGFLFLAVGLLLLWINVWIFGKVLPALFRFLVNGVQKLLYRWKGGR